MNVSEAIKNGAKYTNTRGEPNIQIYAHDIKIGDYLFMLGIERDNSGEIVRIGLYDSISGVAADQFGFIDYFVQDVVLVVPK